MLFYFTEAWDIWDETEDSKTLVALASIAATNGDGTPANSTMASSAPASYTGTRENSDKDQWQTYYEGFFDKLADGFAKVMGCDENCGCGG
jgi:hypothetical protein